MPKVELTVLLGPEDVVWTKSETVPKELVDWAEESMSEFEVLEMPMHDKHYAMGKMKKYAAVPVVVQGFLSKPARHSPAPNVIGNIGEGLGLAAFLMLTGLAPSDVTRVKRRKDILAAAAKRTPDFVASLGSPGGAHAKIRKMLARNAPKPLVKKLATAKALSNFPGRFPVEAKGTMKASGPALWSGIWQLVEYWHTCVQSKMLSEVGYGVVLCTCGIGQESRSVSLHVFAPRVQAKVVSSLGALADTRGSREAFDTQFAKAGGSPFVGS